MSFRLVPLSDREGWEAALQGIPHGFGHTWDSARFAHLGSGLETFLFVSESGAGRTVLPISERSFNGSRDALTPYGYSGFAGVAGNPALSADWAACARERGYVAAYLGLHPLMPVPACYEREAHRHHSVYVLDLRQGESALYRNLAGKGKRSSVKLAAAAEFCRDKERMAAPFKALYRETMARVSASSTYRFADAALDQLIASERVEMFGVLESGRLVIASLFAATEHSAEYHLSASAPEGRSHSAAVVWEAALEYLRRGVPLLNLGGGVKPGDSLAKFKARFGGEERALLSLRQVHDPARYETLCLAAGADARDPNGYFPAYYAK